MKGSESEPYREEEKGCDVHVTVYLMRHAYKDSYAGGLSEAGVRDVNALKEKFRRLVGMYKTDDLAVAHSGQTRAGETAKVLTIPISDLEELKAAAEPQGEVRESLAFKGSDALEARYAELTKEHGGDESAALQMIIDTGEKKYDAESLSSVEMSQRVARELLEIVEQTKNYNAHTKKPIVFISHSGVIENFLVDILEKRSEKQSLNAIGGRINFLEGLRLYINRESPTEVKVTFRFRNWQGELSEEKLKQLAGLS